MSVRATVFAMFLMLAPASVMAEPVKTAEAVETVETERMTWTEIRDAVAAGKTTVIIPTGGTEQNGPHMVTGKHNFIVAETARRIALRLGNALVAPVLAYVPEGDIASGEGHMAYPGSISVPPQVFARVLQAAAESFKAHGFKTIVFLGDSGPNQEPQRQLAAELSQAWAGEGVRVLNTDSYYAGNGQVEMLKSEGESDAAIGQHASIRDTSELMAVWPGGVRTGKFAADAEGVSGDPSHASAERGEKLLALKVDAGVRDIEAGRKAPLTATGGSGWLSWLWHKFGG